MVGGVTPKKGNVAISIKKYLSICLGIQEDLSILAFLFSIQFRRQRKF
jgi:hypothetical protein